MERAYEKRNLKLVDELLQQSVASPNDGRANRLRVCRGNRRVTGARREIGENRAGPQGPEGHSWFWSITAIDFPPSVYNKGYSVTREQAMADFKARWLAQAP
jgi:hypothetical protein